MATRQLEPDEAALYRRLRLTALATEPGAFASTYDEECGLDEGAWRSRLVGFDGRPGRVFVDETEGNANGMVGIGWSEVPGETLLWGMWVVPEARSTGAGRRLTLAAVAWAMEQGAETVTLWVVRTNVAALRLYESAGFVATGDIQPLPSNRCVDELAMRISLTRGPLLNE